MIMRKNGSQALLLKFRKRDSAFGVTRETWKVLAEKLGLSETEAIHVAMSRLVIREGLMKIEGDNWDHDAKEYEGAVDPAIHEPTLEETSMLGANWHEIREVAREYRKQREAKHGRETAPGGRDSADPLAR